MILHVLQYSLECNRNVIILIDIHLYIHTKVVIPTFPELLICFQNPSNPIAKRNRAINTIKHLGGEEYVRSLIAAFPTELTLLEHEICYAFGQIQSPLAIESHFSFTR